MKATLQTSSGAPSNFLGVMSLSIWEADSGVRVTGFESSFSLKL